jgi:1-deoxy-D-xylulose-5-phosphate synthase
MYVEAGLDAASIVKVVEAALPVRGASAERGGRLRLA